MQKKFIPIAVVLAVLLALSAAGYMTPPKKEKMPVRILFQNSGGRVIFSHLQHHRDYGVACAKCHHEQHEDSEEALPCGSCHPQAFDRDYIRDHINSFPDNSYCVKCHHAKLGELNFDHDAHIDYAVDDCQVCHHGPDIEDEPQLCTNCHTNAGTPDVPSIRNAAHDRCINCHDDMFEAGIKGCTPCHKMKDMTDYTGDHTSCKQCHTKPGKDLVLNRVNAFHDQCMDCHRELKRGPYKQEDCDKCHVR